MCGIAGIICNCSLLRNNELTKMMHNLAHRGPDKSGIFLKKNIGIAHTRLSIIDPSTGHQPMGNELESCWITYNGEIYNYQELRSFLINKGYKFRTNSDTEVILYAYEEWGYDCVKKFRGMFAFSIVDFKNQTMFLARDHLGIKPLVYLQAPNLFAFASEIQALRSLSDIEWELDLDAIDQYLLLQYIPAPQSAFKQIKKLPPAHYMVIDFGGEVIKYQRYWQFTFCPDYSKTEAEWLEQLDAILNDSVKHHLVSDVPFGAFLSGGIDSSAVVAYMSRFLNRPIKTFSIGFDEPSYDERKYAEIVSEKWGTEHYSEIVSPNALEILPKLVQHYGEPFGDSSSIPTYYVSKLARKHVPMVLSGDGGDELFAGYASYIAWADYVAMEKPLWKKALKPIACALMPLRYPWPYHGKESLDSWLQFITCLPTAWRERLWKPEFRKSTNKTLDIFEKFYEETRGFEDVHKVQYMDINTYLPYDILTKVDVASMMHGLEVRTPLVDRSVLDISSRIPSEYTFLRKRQSFSGKHLLKKLLSKYYSEDFLYRKKQGFSIPINQWFKDEQIFKIEVEERLFSSESKLCKYFDQKEMKNTVMNQHEGIIWLLLFLEEWMRYNRL